MDPDVKKVLEAAIMAPSGENAQPWKFVVHRQHDKTVIDVLVSEERDQSLYGWGNRASYVAIGAAVENMRIAAPSHGFSVSVSLLPEADNALLAARVSLARGIVTRDPFAENINTRATNRKPYDGKALSDAEIRMLQTVGNIHGCVLRIFTTREEISTLARIGSVNELIMLNNPILHSFFFNHVNWTRAEDDEKKVGFFIDTLELSAPAQMGFLVMRSWPRARFLNRFLGFNKLVAKQNAALYGTASAMGVVISKEESPLEAVKAGMSVERIWLAADSLGLSIQPLTGVLYWALRGRAGIHEGFSDAEHAEIMRAYKDLDSIARLGGGISYFMFRIGHADAPTARATRFSVDDVTTIL
ncbi:nitroreductase family protein [Candidatus Kaiserbacteria bacterium]|nr:nitroreductase family protein [Candidatus Kaiserbacteria bacterium]